MKALFVEQSRSRTLLAALAAAGRVLLLLAVLALFVLRFGFYGILVEGDSMETNYHTDDGVLVVRQDSIFTRGFVRFSRGDVVIIKIDEDTNYIKRIVAVGGDTLIFRKRAAADGRQVVDLYLNGEVQAEAYIREPMTTDNNTFKDVTMDTDIKVPAGYYFCMGDNRNHSMDSRDASVGFIAYGQLLGEVLTTLKPHSLLRWYYFRG
ncbi:MAG: signal peptidase I [Clostridiales bacterium]|jgi:signal peptidase I|nr:signal peptidase I [Clostridiales bacterium]